ncbi:MAG: divalent cation tolerance protein CutA [Verrucomicrobia bacterium]|nr:MAG: divalent cation tolerance protein CutA [Verrucomicrobiota bacterium]
MKSSARHVAVLVTVPDRRTARALAAAALEARECACAQIVSGLESHYRWKGRLEKSRELLVIFKTRRARVNALARTVSRLHPYEVPQCVVVPLSGGSADYLAWIDAGTTPAKPAAKAARIPRGKRPAGGFGILPALLCCLALAFARHAVASPVPTPLPPTWLTYHLAHPGATATGDPNAAFFWKGRYHLHYILEDKAGVTWAHVSSPDMVHWQWHPATLTPATMGHDLFSGTGFLTKDGRPAIIYHGAGSGRNQISFAEDDALEKWSKPIAVEPRGKDGKPPSMRHWDPDCWLDGDTYYAVSGGKDPHLMKSPDLGNWQYLGHLLHDGLPDLGVPRDEDISCPNMFRIGDRWMLLCLSHWLGCRYYLGDFRDGKFLPDFHARMNWMCEFNGDADLFAPESVRTPDGRRVMWAWSRVKERLKGVAIQSSIQSLPRELSLPRDGKLRIRPLRELESLRFGERTESNVAVDGGTPRRLEGIRGDALEIEIVFAPGTARRFGVAVYCDADGGHGFPIAFEPGTATLTLGETRVPLELRPGEDLVLRVFLDKNLVEVFANDRQAALAPHRYAPDHLGVALFGDAGRALAKTVKAWNVRSIYTAPGSP